MKPDQLLRAILPEVLIDNFDIDRFEKSDSRFDIWLDKKKEQLREDKYNNNNNIISYGFGDYRTIQDYPIRGRAAHLHVRKRKWLLTKPPARYSATNGMYPSSTAQGLTPSLSLFKKRKIDSTPVSIFTLAARNGLNGQTLRRQYKEVISGYRLWNQLGHADEYILYPDNFGSDMSLDETCLSNGDVYTILTNKGACGGKGALAAMVRGVASDTVSAILRKVPLRQRLKVRTVTTDPSSAMMLTVRNVFPGASLVNDRFHVQQLTSEAVDQLRIRHRWKVLDAENKAIGEHRQKRKEAKSKEERELVGQGEPGRMENGETMPQIMAHSRHIILKHKSKWNEQQKIRARILFRIFPDPEKGIQSVSKTCGHIQRENFCQSCQTEPRRMVQRSGGLWE